MDDTYARPVDAGIKPTYQDMELGHKGVTKLAGPDFGDEAEKLRKTMAHPNEADVAMQNLLDKNGKR